MTSIAIIGLSCLFPGAETPEKYWQNLVEKKDLTSLANEDQMGVDANLFYDAVKGKTDKYYCMRGGYVQGFQFDATGYQIAPAILTNLDKIYQWSLYVSKQALQDSGYLENRSVLSNCGVILGNLSFPTRYSHRLFTPIYHKVINSAIQELLQDKSFDLQKLSSGLSPLNGVLSGYPAALISQGLSLSRINFSLDAACASSLYAIKLACDYLLSGKADLMLAGAVSCADPLFIHLGFSIFQAYPENGVTRPLDKSSAGLISGEGAGMIVLKRYDDALRDGDRIYATINGIGLSNDGKGKFVLNPNPKGQILAFERAYTNADINPNSIDYVECHATGTPIGDITELNSMDAFFGRYQASPLIGSVKSNFGHLLTTAGMTGLIKVILSMNKEVIPPTINLIEPLSSDNGGILAKQIVSSTIPWPNNASIKRAGVSAFGFGGTNAHLILESSKKENLDLGLTKNNLIKHTTQNRLAIVGMEACFGSCEGLDTFDRTIYEAHQHFIPVPPQRWKGIESQPELLKDYDFVDGKAPHGAYIQDFDLDFLRFKIPPHEEEELIPQQLLMLKVADNAIKDAGIVEGGNVAVIIAMGTELALHQYLGRIDLSWQTPASLQSENTDLSPEKITELETIVKNSLYSEARINNYTSFIGNLMATRISALWDFSGPAFTVSAEENSVFKSLEIAQILLSQGEVDAVVIGAVDLAGSFENVLLRHQLAPVNTGTHTLSYDTNANGWMVGEGAGAVVLKRYETAQQQPERIYAIIDAIALVQNNSGDKSLKSVQQACEQAFSIANIQPQHIGYLEVFGSGIAQEDAAEITGLNLAYKQKEESKNDHLTCCIGSIKANIGHTYAASGMASLIKTALCLYHRYIPATPQWSKPKNLENWQNSIFYVASESRTWFLDEGISKRVAAINGLGLDGTYAHLIISEEASQKERPSKYLEQTPFYLFPLVADDQAALLAEIHHLKQQIENTPSLSNIATQTYQNFQQNIQGNYKLALVGHNQEELLKEINLVITGISKAFHQKSEWKTPLGSYFTANPLGKKGKIAFVYPGMGSADIGLGKDIIRLFPQIYEIFSNSVPNIGESLCEKLIYPRSLTKFSETDKTAKIERFFNDGAAMCLSSISLSFLYTLILQDCFQIQPQVACGYSLGEASGMLFALGVWNSQCHSYSSSAIAAIIESPLFKTQLCGSCLLGRQFWGLSLTDKQEKFWTSYLLKASALEVIETLKSENKVYLTFINTPQEVVIAGNPQSCLRIIEKLKCRYITISFDSVLHSEIAESVYDEIVKLHTLSIQKIPNIELYSGVTADKLVINTNSLAQNSAKICCQTVDFPRLINQIYQDGARIFIEVGAKNNCSQWISANLKELEHIAIPINTKSVDDHTSIIKLLATLISHGVDVDLSSLYSPLIKTDLTSKSILKKVILGGLRIYDQILHEDHIAKFKNQLISQLDRNHLLVRNTKSKSMKSPSISVNYQQFLRINQLQISTSQQMLNSNFTLQENICDRSSIQTLYLETPTNTYTKASNIVWDEADLLEFAKGNIASVFGQDYQIIDSYSRRVRLPMPPYLLVSRVTKIDAEKGRFQPSSMTTEYDIPKNAWYSVDGQIPLSVAIESGQCDLLLISYLGIDFENKGDLIYRLLDCTLTFLDDLAKEGETLRYDIKINSFAKNGNNLLFFFSYECFVGDKMVLKMDRGCAGFFSDQQLKQGKGIIFTEKEIAQRSQIKKQYFEPLLVCQKSTFDEPDILHLIEGNIAACFGDHYCQYGLNPSLRLPPKAILMIDRVISIEPTGGAWGLGLIIGEKTLDPEHWYFPCHFKDDQVMAGSLMAEGCSHLLEFYMLYLGLQTYTTDARFQPIPNLPQVVRCRGQVTPTSAKLIYQMEISEIGLTPKPYVKCNVSIILHEKIIVHFQDLGLQLSEKNPENSTHTKDLIKSAPIKVNSQKPALLNEEQIQEFCTGSPSKCFGSEYEIYDAGTVIVSRMPNTHLQLVHRILEVQGQRHQFTKGSTIISEYDVPLDPWYCRQNSSEAIPYSILMEIGLQPCGFLSAYLGTTLLYPNQSLCFRNLDGQGHLIKDIDIRGKTITNIAKLVSSINMKGNILQKFEFKVACDGEVFYTGDASFGYFSPESLANQVGLDSGQDIRPWYETKNNLKLPEIQINLRTPESRNKYYQIQPHRPHYRLAQYELDVLNELKIIVGGGNYNQGYIYAQKQVKPTDWYFKCHFYLDPVMPGSLGVEAILQAMQAYALHLDLGKQMKSPRFVPVMDHQVIWKYRGQIPQTQTLMYLEVHISKIDITEEKITLVGDASLWKPNLRIYEVKNVAICLMESGL